MSEIVNMSRKMNALVDHLTKDSSIGERLVFEMLINTAYIEGYKDGYAKGYMESVQSPPEGGAR